MKIYTLSNPLNKEIKYVGITKNSLNKRLSQHLCETRNNKRKSWIISLKKKNITPAIELLDEVDDDLWIEEEKFYISYFKYLGFNLVNMTEGGDRIEMTNEIRNKIRNKILGTKRSKETKNKIRIANLENRCGTRGRKLTKEHKLKISISNKGKKLNQETRDKISLSKNKKPISQFTLEGVFIKKFESISKCCKLYNWSKGNIIKVCKHKIRKDGSKCKTAYGYIWEYS